MATCFGGLIGVLSEKRQAAKRIRYGILYGMENTALVNQLVMYVMEAVKFKAQFLGIEEVPEGMCGRREDSEEGQMCCLCEWEEEETVTAQGSDTVVVNTAMLKGTGFNGRKIKWDVKK